MADTKIIKFSGCEWEVRPDGTGEPGPSNWSSNNVWVDEEGLLHLKITQKDGKWNCAEIYTTESLGFGKYQFYVIGRIDLFDPNIVLGLFNFQEGATSNGINEIDIEITKWGDFGNPNNGYFTVWPSVDELEPVKHDFSFSLNGTYTTHRFDWNSKKVHFQSLHDHTNNDEYEIASWSYQPNHSLDRIPQQPLRVHMNLWLSGGKPPTDLKEVEVIIKSFKFTPAS